MGLSAFESVFLGFQQEDIYSLSPKLLDREKVGAKSSHAVNGLILAHLNNIEE